MKGVLHVSTNDIKGGSGRSAYRIHGNLLKSGLRSYMVVGNRYSDDYTVNVISKGLLRKADFVARKAWEFLSWQDAFYPSSYYVDKHPWFKEADIVQMYNIHLNYFSFTVLPRLCRKKPLVWRLSDQWPLTGHCAYSYNCFLWKTGCNKCPNLEEYPSLKRDTASFLWKLKQRTYKNISRMVIVAPSLWIKKLTQESPLLSRFTCYHIPNGVSTGVFKPADRTAVRNFFGLSKEDRVILFVAEQLKTDRRKGGEFLLQALSLLPERLRKQTVLTLVGGENVEKDLPVRVFQAGYLESDEKLAQLYQMADIMVLPTLAENLPNTALESMACGTPVVTFDTGGMSELIKHMDNGYIVRYQDVQDLKKGIETLLNDAELREKMGKAASALINKEYSAQREVKEFISLYNEILK